LSWEIVEGAALAILALLTAFACLLAMWAAWWWTSVLAQPATRASRIANVITPILIALPLIVVAAPILDYLGIDLTNLDWGYPRGPALFFAFAVVILVPTLLVSLLTDSAAKRLRKK
jgi:hypothetical protein